MSDPGSSQSAGGGSTDGRTRRRGPLTGLALLAILGSGVGVFVAITLSSYRRSPDLEGLLTGLFAGLITGLLVVLGLLMAVKRLVEPPRPQVLSAAESLRGAELETLLAPSLRELETIRAETARRIGARIALFVPLGVTAGLALWTVLREPADVADTVLHALQFAVVGGVAGYGWAERKLGQGYRRLYKDRVLPEVAATFGALGYRAPVGLDTGRLLRHGVFEAFDRVVAEDEIHGEHRGLPVRIVEATLTQGSGKHKRTIFHGLLAEVGLPRALSGTTAVISDAGMFGNLRGRFREGETECVRLEDPRFEKHYEVYGSDQIAARALLTPAFIERFLVLAELPGFGKPSALAQDNDLMLILPDAGGGDRFEPPSWRRPAASRMALVKLSADIEAVLKLADAVIDLDQFARERLAR